MRSYLRLAVACLVVAGLAVLGVCQASAEGVPSRSKVKTSESWSLPSYTPEPAVSGVHWYVGAVGAYTWVPDEARELDIGNTWSGGFVGGFLWRYGTFGAGAEADYVVRDLGDFTLDDGVWSLRARLGMFVTDQTFIYMTGGIAGVTSDLVPGEFNKGLVIGGGIEREVLKGLAVRAEVLHYRHGDDYFEWGDHGSNQARVGLVLKF